MYNLPYTSQYLAHKPTFFAVHFIRKWREGRMPPRDPPEVFSSLLPPHPRGTWDYSPLHAKMQYLCGFPRCEACFSLLHGRKGRKREGDSLVCCFVKSSGSLKLFVARATFLEFMRYYVLHHVQILAYLISILGVLC